MDFEKEIRCHGCHRKSMNINGLIYTDNHDDDPSTFLGSDSKLIPSKFSEVGLNLSSCFL